MSQVQPGQGQLSRRTLLAYGSMGFPLAVLGYPLALFLHPYYADELGLGLAAISTVLLLTRITDFVTDPLMGWVSDRTRSRFGRRIPYLVLGLPVMMLGIWKLFMPEPPVDIWYMFVWNTVMYLGWTILVMPYTALGAEITVHYMDRARINASRQVYVIAGLIGASALIWFSQQMLGMDSPGELLTGLGVTLLVLFPVVVVAVVLLVPEPKTTVPEDVQQPWLRSLRSMLRIGPFRRLVYVAIAIVVGEASRHAVLVFFMQDVMQSAGRIGMVYTLYYTCGVAAIPLWQWLAKRYGKHRALAVAMTSSAFWVMLTGFCGPDSFNLFLVFFVLKGLSFGAFAYLPLAMVADVVDVDNAVTRQRRAGLFYAVHGAVDKVGLAIGLFLALQLLNLSGYDPQVEATANGLLMLRVEYAFLPSFFFLLASYLVWNYPVTAERHQKLVAALERRATRQDKRRVAEALP